MELQIKAIAGKLAFADVEGISVEVDILPQDARFTPVSILLRHAADFLLDDWQLSFVTDRRPDFCWAPQLTPEDGHVIDRQVFRCPAAVFAGQGWVTALLPDLGVMAASPQRWYMDVDAPESRLSLGMGEAAVDGHVLFRRMPGQVLRGTETHIACFLFHSEAPEDVENPFRAILDFYWRAEGEPLYLSAPQPPYAAYCAHAYAWALGGWPDVWQEFELDGRRVGAPAFIVNYTQSPGAAVPATWRESLSVWNQAWFQSLRSAAGLYRYAQRIGDWALREKALLTKELALTMPRARHIAHAPGLFYSVVATRMAQEEGRFLSLGWGHRYFGNSNRNPVTANIEDSPFHLTDMSLTCRQMLQWYLELEQDERLLEYCEEYAASLLVYQDVQGFFPAWVDQAGQPLPQLAQSPETSASAWFLATLYTIRQDERYLDAAKRALDAVLQHVVPIGRWEDFETYYSCCRYGGDHLGKKFERNGMFKQCNFSMYWTAEACYALYQVSGHPGYLNAGRRVLDELLMTQAVWNPPYLAAPVFGGFGVMNCDGEWLDARQSLFAEIILRYGEALHCREYLQRGLAALNASFVLMYCPQNPAVSKAWEQKYPFFGAPDYGFMMENYGHDGFPETAMGEFAIFDWGAGAACEAYQRILDHYPELF